MKGLIFLILILLFAVSFLITFFTSPLTIKIAKRVDAMDVPLDSRRMHKIAIPRCGGLAIAFSTIVSLVLAYFFVIPIFANVINERFFIYDPSNIKLLLICIPALLISLLGFYDDVKTIGPYKKLVGQIICALILAFLGIRIDVSSFFSFIPEGIFNTIISFVVTVLWVVLLTNTINLIDGLDGLASGVSAIAAVSISYASYIHGHYLITIAFVALAGASSGFLPINFHPAKTFMGDCGSMFLGFMLAGISIISPAKGATLLSTFMPLLLAFGLPLIDVILAIIRRILGHKSPMEADKKHIHHRVTEKGLGHTKSVLMIYGISGLTGFSAINYSRGQYFEFIGLFIIAIVFIVVLISSNSEKESKSGLDKGSGSDFVTDSKTDSERSARNVTVIEIEDESEECKKLREEIEDSINEKEEKND